jgi:peptidyl-prolyl cis-trans isomerase A (cyclophilin A)/peptidyl-prolyl cis-trans isomerase-like 1
MKKIYLGMFALTLFATNKLKAQTDVIFYTSMGIFEAEMYDTLQPITAGNFISLVEEEFYDGIIFHRIVDGFIVQGGDPTGTGYGGPGYTIEDEFDPLASNVVKSLAMANSGPNTAGSQFYINMVNNVFLDPNYPVFGIVTESFDIVQDIEAVPVDGADRPLTDVVMDSVRIKTVYLSAPTEDLPSLEITISPNPVTDIINVSILNSDQEHRVSLINNAGQVFFEEVLIDQQTIPAAALQSGIYFVVITNNEGKMLKVEKVMVGL